MTHPGVDVTKDGNMAVARCGELWLAATGDERIADETWREYLELAKASVASHGPFTGLYLLFPRNAPSTSQRNMLTNEYGRAVRIDQQRRVAVISDSAITRGAMTAISWLTSGKIALRAFSPSAGDRRRALDWLGEEIAFDRVIADSLEQGLSTAVRMRLAG